MEKWYEKTRRWGQVNLSEIDPEICDLGFWQEFWKKTGTQGIIVNAGGIVAYYPSRFEMHYRAAKLGNRDFFGDFIKAGRDLGLVILARMDINRAIEAFYKARPDWFAQKKDGSPFITQGRFLSCLNSGYYKEYIPEILKEIIEKYQPEGFTDNSWTGIPKQYICYCDNCKKGFQDYSGCQLPENADYQDLIYRKWIEWSYSCRIDNWDLFNKVCTEYGGEDCLWMGMVNANVMGHNFCDLREVAKRSKMFMVDHQGRDGNGFEQNSLNGQVLHQLVGWDKVIPESMATYTRGKAVFRRSASPALELKLWMLEGIAGGISPWWHVIGSSQEDKRIFEIAQPIMRWHQEHEKYLYNRKPIANVGVLWSQENVEFGGGILGREKIANAWRGINMALTRSGFPYLPINMDDISNQTKGIDLLILPEIALITEEQAKALETFVARGGNLLAFGSVGIMDDLGKMREKSRLERILGIRFNSIEKSDSTRSQSWEEPIIHNYIRIEDSKSPLFTGFENSAILPMGGFLHDVSTEPSAKVLATYIPSFPIYPPEFAYTELTHTRQPAIVEYETGGGGKTIYVAWDLDTAYGYCALPDHGDLIGNMLKYLLKDNPLVRVECDAYIDFKFYKQDNRIIIHLININHTGFSHGYAEKIIPLGPVKIVLNLPNFIPTKAIATEDDQKVEFFKNGDGFNLILEYLFIHQLIILE